MGCSQQLSLFLDSAREDPKLTPTHIGLYTVLLYYWKKQAYLSPVVIVRTAVMSLSKISGRSTYNKCMKELHAYGYIHYEPTFNPYAGSLVYLIGFAENIELGSPGKMKPPLRSRD